ncbi:MAG: hypothetical protein A2832_01400 [Candidatus Zambryskibacteria bacterium RIFCSPHIGHO2_01_FULL_44_22b]|uniref:Uncharacterized protein n=1 Tax=Candidatus Zambryskibacteria bacterium RIFCSPHIGHO2_01_FULL_44_22b TaxID=1802737 RepID=A0A1G2T0E5_9BACT|nr:MAG: hypothetical protein A2832_01400 [Candidatus Zambryskibacteria bacterium RIFCSPHIGHO2_01_FULL_44_22b]
MNKWSRKRKRIIVSLVFFVFVILVAVPAYLLFYKPPTCFDNKRNGDETGVDCGGSCQLLCTSESLPLIIKGDPQVLKVKEGVFEVVALVDNPNTDAEIYKAKYFIRLYSAQSIAPTRVIEGETFVPKGAKFAIFEGPFTTSDGIIPIKATIEWREDSLEWKKNTSQVPKLIVVSKSVSREDSVPRLDAVIENSSLKSVSNVDVIALIYNDKGTIFAASKTFIDSLAAGANAPIVFSWPEPFSEKVINADIILRVLPDRSFIR